MAALGDGTATISMLLELLQIQAEVLIPFCLTTLIMIVTTGCGIYFAILMCVRPEKDNKGVASRLKGTVWTVTFITCVSGFLSATLTSLSHTSDSNITRRPGGLMLEFLPPIILFLGMFLKWVLVCCAINK